MSNRPGGELAKRPLQFFWLCDTSGSMAGPKIQTLNYAMREALPAMKEEAAKNPGVSVQVRVITFDSDARWHIATPTDIESFTWTDLTERGQTAMGEAIDLLSEALDIKNMPERGLPPVAVLLSDGQPNGRVSFDAALERLVRLPWGAKLVRIAIAIGDDADLNVLQQFIGMDPRERPPLIAKNATDLVKLVKWASTVPLAAASRPSSRVVGSTATTHVDIPLPPPPTTGPINPGDVF